MIGKTFGRLTVIERVENVRRRRRWRCRCECGGETVTLTYLLRSGNTRSCGCLSREMSAQRLTTHNGRGTPEYGVWTTMRTRCLNPNASSYARYGGRGIAICPEWNDFAAFLLDMGPRPTPQHSIDRRDNDGPYAPDNCRWATAQEQSRNRRTNRMLEHDGECLPMAAWSERSGVDIRTLWRRLERGVSIAEAMRTL